MSRIRILRQPFSGNLGNVLIEQLSKGPFNRLDIAVAFAKNSGVLRMSTAMKRFRLGGGRIRVFVGVDLEGTSYEALESLLVAVDELYVVHVESSQTFHPKIYWLTNESEGLVCIGSHNMTGGGLWRNVESSAAIALSFTDDDDNSARREIEDYFDFLANQADGLSRRITDHDQIDYLLESGYVEHELTEKVPSLRKNRNGSKQGSNNKEVLFRNSIPAPIPSAPASFSRRLEKYPGSVAPTPRVGQAGDPSTSPAVQSALHNHPRAGKTFPSLWFETRRMTGGSANQLDLSMKALVTDGDPIGTEYEADDSPKMMLGGVHFFEVDPTAVSKETELTINYQGVDYKGNSIIFPEGEKANGTWRLRINGVADDGSKISSLLNSGLLKDKVVVFTRIDHGYYYMSVFGGDGIVDEFKEASSLVAHNGTRRNAKYIGVI